MPEFPVVGCHRSGTSLTAGILATLGVNMGDRMHPPSEWNDAHWEDLDFWELNHSIYDAALTPEQVAKREEPDLPSILVAGKWFRYEIENLVRWKQHRRMWGWKDPLNVWTIDLYIPYLNDPHFVCTMRNKHDVAASLVRGWKGDEYWTQEVCERRAERSLDRVARFADRSSFPVCIIEFDKLVHREMARPEVEKLARFVGTEDPRAIEAALAQIKFRGE